MSVRTPKSQAFSRFQAAEAGSPLEAEIAAEKAAALGRAGRAVEKALAHLNDPDTPDPREDRLLKAAEAVQGYFLVRELNGFRDHREIVRRMEIPREVLNRIGIVRRPR